MKRTALILSLLTFLSACSTVQVVDIGGGYYRVTTLANEKTSAETSKMNWMKAVEFCSTKKMNAKEHNESIAIRGKASGESIKSPFEGKGQVLRVEHEFKCAKST